MVSKPFSVFLLRVPSGNAYILVKALVEEYLGVEAVREVQAHFRLGHGLTRRSTLQQMPSSDRHPLFLPYYRWIADGFRKGRG
jgi:hypothetical protein